MVKCHNDDDWGGVTVRDTGQGEVKMPLICSEFLNLHAVYVWSNSIDVVCVWGGGAQ